MRAISLLRGLVVVAGVLLLLRTAWAQETPRQIQGMIANGQAQAALGQLQGALQAHPTSGVAWYLSAEAQDSLGNAAAARYDLAQADHFAPGLPFARASDVAALRAHVQAAGVGVSSGGHGGGIGMGVILIGGLVLFVLWRLFRRRRYQPGFGGFQGQAPDGRYPYGPGYGPGGGGMAPGAGGSLLSGLAAGAGFAVGERVVDDMMGNRGGGMIDPAQGSDQWQSPDRDDGLSGSPGWDAGSNDPGDDFDQGNSW